MIQPSRETLTQRLDRLERENRRWKRAASACSLVLALTLLSGAAPTTMPEEIKARRLVLVDQRGVTRAILGTDFDHFEHLSQVALKLFDSKGKQRLHLFVHNDGPKDLHSGWPKAGLSLLTEAEKEAASLNIKTDNSTDLLLRDGKSIGRAWIRLTQDGKPSVLLFDENDRLRAAMGHVVLETPRVEAVTTRPASSLVLFDKDGKVIWTAP